MIPNLKRAFLVALPIILWTAPVFPQDFPNEPPYTQAPEPGFDSKPPQAIPATRTSSKGPRLGPISRAFTLRVGAFRPMEITNERTGLSFSEMYGDRKGPIVFLDYDWHLTQAVGRLSFRLGTGVYISKPGRGKFVSNAPSNVGLRSEERFTYLVFPNTATLQYKFQYHRSQWFVPYVDGGGGYFTFMENRDDKFSPRLGGAPVGVAGGGLQILLDHFDTYSVGNLRRDYGIQHVWLVLDFKSYLGSGRFDFTSSVLNAGFHLEF